MTLHPSTPSPLALVVIYMVNFLYYYLSCYDYFDYEIYRHFHVSVKSPKVFRAAVIA